MSPYIKSHPGLNYDPELVDKTHGEDLLDALAIKADQARNPHIKDRSDQILYMAGLTDGRQLLMYTPSLEAFCRWNGTRVSFRMDIIDRNGERRTYEQEGFNRRNNPEDLPKNILDEIFKICREFTQMNMGRVHARNEIRAILSEAYYNHR